MSKWPQVDLNTMQDKFLALNCKKTQQYFTALLLHLLTQPTTMQICSCLFPYGKCQNLFWEI